MLVVSVILGVNNTQRAFASTKSDDIEYVTGCPSSYDGRHHMEGRSSCAVYVTSTGTTKYGHGAQCKYCHLFLVSRYNLNLNPNIPMGWYATEQCAGYLGPGVTIDASTLHYNNSTSDPIWSTFVWE